MSQLFLRTLRDDPADAEVDSHRLLVRAGYIRRVGERHLRLAAARPPGAAQDRGRSCARRWTPPARRSCGSRSSSRSSSGSAAGATQTYGPLMFRLESTARRRRSASRPRPRRSSPRRSRASTRATATFPVNLYQINWKYRDELRPRFGLLRGREFLMKDAYSFDRDLEGLQARVRRDVRRVRPRVRPLRAHVPRGRRRSRARSAATRARSSWPSRPSARTPSSGASTATTPPTPKPRRASRRPRRSSGDDVADVDLRAHARSRPASTMSPRFLGVEPDELLKTIVVRRRRRARSRGRARRP